MKKLLLLLFCGLLPLVHYAQPRKVQRINVEAAAGVGLELGGRLKDLGVAGAECFTFKLETRYNLRSLPLNFGLSGSMADCMHGAASTVYDECGNNETILGLMILADYNLRHGRLVNPYVGIAVGSAFITDDDNGNFSPCIAPRIGVRLLRHLSLSADYKIVTRQTDFNHADVMLGLYF